jgi:hypothetical protein
MRLICHSCGSVVSSEVPEDVIVRAFIECPECIEKNKYDLSPIVGHAFVSRIERMQRSPFGWQMTLQSTGEFDEAFFDDVCRMMMQNEPFAFRSQIEDSPLGKVMVSFALESPCGETPSVETPAVPALASPQPQSPAGAATDTSELT